MHSNQIRPAFDPKDTQSQCRPSAQFALFMGAHMKYPIAIVLWLVAMWILASLEVAYTVRLILQILESNNLRFLIIGEVVFEILFVCE